MSIPSAFFAPVPTARCWQAELATAATALVRGRTRFQSRDLADVQRHLQAQHDSIRLDIADPTDLASYREVKQPIGPLLLTIGCIDARNGYELAYQSRDEYLVNIPLRGEGWVSSGDLVVEVEPDDVMITAPSSPVLKHWYGPGEVLSINIPVQEFDRVRHRLYPDDATAFTAPAPISTVRAASLGGFLRLIDMLCREIADCAPGTMSSLLHAPVVTALTDAIVMLFVQMLLADERSIAVETRATSPAVPYYVRRAEDFISANARRDITLDDLAAAAGVSVRSLQYGFRRYRDTTPMLFVKRIRHERARALLRTATGARRKVCEIAAEIGYTNTSQFSRDYRAMFGESPSQTVAMPRALISGTA